MEIEQEYQRPPEIVIPYETQAGVKKDTTFAVGTFRKSLWQFGVRSNYTRFSRCILKLPDDQGAITALQAIALAKNRALVCGTQKGSVFFCTPRGLFHDEHVQYDYYSIGKPVEGPIDALRYYAKDSHFATAALLAQHRRGKNSAVSVSLLGNKKKRYEWSHFAQLPQVHHLDDFSCHNNRVTVATSHGNVSYSVSLNKDNALVIYCYKTVAITSKEGIGQTQ
jgi:hypothetical protein